MGMYEKKNDMEFWQRRIYRRLPGRRFIDIRLYARQTKKSLEPWL